MMVLGEGWRFAILGRLQILDDGLPVLVRSRLAGRLLVALLLHAGEVVQSHDLVDAVWEVAPANPANSLHVLVRRLRTMLGSPDWIQPQGRGYVFRLGMAELDVDRFRTYVSAARASDGPAERALWTSALSLWPPLEIEPDLSLMTESASTELAEERLSAAIARIELELADGAYDCALPDLRKLTRSQPMREELWELLLVALRDSGRHAEAVAAYADARREFAAQLGVEPGLRLRAIYTDLLAADNAFAQWHEDDRWQAQSELPPDLGQLIGRADAAKQVVTALLPAEHVPVAMIWGQPGVGKSALAVHVAHQLREHYPDGQWYVPLTTVGSSTSPAEILEWLLVASGMPRGLLPRSVPARSAALRNRLADRRVLLVIDGVTSSQQILSLLPGTAGNAVLITGVGALTELPDAYHLRLPSLSSDDGYAFLAAVLGEDRVQGQRAAALEVAGLCSGLPLALRIAAARLLPRPDLDLAWLAGRLRNQQTRLDELAVGDLQLRSSVQLAYESLEPSLRRAAHCASWLPRSGFAAWAVGAFADGSDGELLAERLVAAGLLEPLGIDAAGQQRYHCHDLVSVFVRERTETSNKVAGREYVGRLLRTAFAAGELVYKELSGFAEDLKPLDATTVQARPPVFDGDAATWVRTESAVLLTVIDFGCRVGLYVEAARLADLVMPAVGYSGNFDQLLVSREHIRDAAFAAGDELVGWRAEFSRADTLLADGLLDAERTLRRCAAAFERLAAHDEWITSLSVLAFVRARKGSPDLELARKACVLADERADPGLVEMARRGLMHTLLALKRPSEALTVAQTLIVTAERAASEMALWSVLNEGAHAAIAAHELELASSFCRRSDEMDVQDYPRICAILLLWSRIHTASGRGAQAVATASQALELMIRTGNRRGAAAAQFRLGQALVVDGDHKRAASVVSTAVPLLRRTGEMPLVRAAERLLADIESVGKAAVPALFP